MKMNIFKKDRGKAVFIIPAAVVAIILIACIVVTVTAGHGRSDKSKQDKTKAKQDISKVDNSDKGVLDVTENTESDIKEAIELVKQEETKDSNVTEKADDEETTNSSPADTPSNMDAAAGGGKSKDTSSGNKNSSGSTNSTGSTGSSASMNSSGNTASSGKNSGNSGGSSSNNSTSQGGTTTNEPAQSEQPKNEYVAPGWIYYGSKAGNGMTGEQKAYLDSVVKQWTNGGLSNSYIEDLFLEKIDQEWGLPMSTAGVTNGQRCLYPSLSEVPDYGENLAEVGGAYNFMGLYTKGEYDEYGYLICYYWEAGVL